MSRKDEIKSSLKVEDIFNLVQEWGGDPIYTSFGFISTTICHNPPKVGSKKLYFYNNSNLFKCYTGCGDYFDIFDLFIRVQKIQNNREIGLKEALNWFCLRFGFSQFEEIDGFKLYESSNDWQLLDQYNRIKEDSLSSEKFKIIQLKEYDDFVLNNFNYDIKITPWLNEGISQDVLNYNRIGFYPGHNQITIPHYDFYNRLIGIRGRSVAEDDCDMYGKYRPLKVNQLLYNHPLGMNLFNLNHSKDKIEKMRKAILFEGEKSPFLYQTYFGIENDISVACCGSNVTFYQIELLLNLNVEEIVIAYDRQFQKLGDDDFKKLTLNLNRIKEKYKNYVRISYILDEKKITAYKASPIDEGPDKFLFLYKNRRI